MLWLDLGRTRDGSVVGFFDLVIKEANLITERAE